MAISASLPKIAHHRAVHAEADEERNGNQRGDTEQPCMSTQRLDIACVAEAHHER